MVYEHGSNSENLRQHTKNENFYSNLNIDLN